jgi:hypothetical protein
MAGYGWAYLTVTHELDSIAPSFFTATEGSTPAASQVWRASDDSAFTSEEEMLRELGVTGWELVSMRESKGRVIYYFKRSRS